MRTGQYPNETILTTANVNAAQFGKRVSYPVDGQLYAQPLYLPNLSIGGSTHNVVFAATENDSVYAFDADQTSAVAPLWKTSLLPGGAHGGASPASSPVAICNRSSASPARRSSIPATNTMFVVAYDQENGNRGLPSARPRHHHRGGQVARPSSSRARRRAPAPAASAVRSPSTPAWNGSGPPRAGERPVYVAFASFCDIGDYHGWILGYSYNGHVVPAGERSTTTRRTAAQGGIWGGGAGLVADNAGNLYYDDRKRDVRRQHRRPRRR